MQTKPALKPFDEEVYYERTQVLQSILKDMQRQSTPPSPRADAHVEASALFDQETLLLPAVVSKVTRKLPEFHRKTALETLIDQRICDFREAHVQHFPHIIHVNAIRKLEYIVWQLESSDAPVKWHSYVFHHRHGWIEIQLDARVMEYHEVVCE
jgi:hypothetical protein